MMLMMLLVRLVMVRIISGRGRWQELLCGQLVPVWEHLWRAAGFEKCPISFENVSHTALRRMAGQGEVWWGLDATMVPNSVLLFDLVWPMITTTIALLYILQITDYILHIKCLLYYTIKYYIY